MTSARENPFAVERIESLIPFDPKWLDTDWDAILEQFQEADYHGAIVGPHGSGKSTFLDTFEPIFSEKTGMLICRLFLNEEKPELTRHEKLFITNCPDNAATVIFLDGAEQMNFWDRSEFKRLTHGFGGVLTTRHSKKRNEPVILETETSVEMLRSFVIKLMPNYPGTPVEIAALFAEAEGNIRDALRLAYDRISES